MITRHSYSGKRISVDSVKRLLLMNVKRTAARA